MNRLNMTHGTAIAQETTGEDDVEGHGLHFPIRSVTEKLVRLCEDLEAQHIPPHGSWIALAQVDMAHLSSEWLRESSAVVETVSREGSDAPQTLPLSG